MMHSNVSTIYLFIHLLVYLSITETSPYSFGDFRKLSLYNCFMHIKLALNTKILYKTNTNMYILHVLSMKLRYKLYFSFSIPTPGFPHFYYM